MGTAAGLLAEARKTLGMTEHPPGSNRNPIVTWYNANIDRIGAGAWCNMSVTCWAGRSGNLNAIFAGKGIGYAYTVYHARKFQKVGRWHYGTAGIRAGDVVFFNWTGRRDIDEIDHVGIVEKVRGGIIYTIEGNKGDRCVRVARDSTYIVGYGRPAYSSTSSKPQEDDVDFDDRLKLVDGKGKPNWPGQYIGGSSGKHKDISVQYALGYAAMTPWYIKEHVLPRLDALTAANTELVQAVTALAADPNAVSVEEILRRIEDKIEGVTVHLEVPDEEPTA